MKLAYSLAMPEPETHLYHVRLDVTQNTQDSLRFVLPSWTPGSYLIRDYARHVQDFEARDGRGRALPWQRADKQSWVVEAKGATKITIEYRVYANELSVQTSHLDATHAYGNGTNLFAYVDGAKELPVTLVVKPWKNWKVDIALPRARGAFAARDYDHLADSPFEIGDHRRFEFRARGKRHRVALYGSGNENAEQLVADLKKIVEEEAAIFGGLPYDEYLFIIHLSDKPGGGLEHRGSNTSTVDRWTFQPGKKYEDFLALEAHEFFHTWNVKRLRPAALGPFDYTKENYTTLLWAMEGITSYYDHLVLARAGLITEERFREYTAELVTKLRQQPGRFKLSLSQSSFLTWVKLYKQDANWQNTGVSYYLKGELVGLILDLAIRDRTRGKKSLDDVLRYLYDAYPIEGPGIPELHHGGKDGWRLALETVTGLSWKTFWAKYIDGTEEVDFERFLKRVGWNLKPVRKDDKPEEKLKKGDYAAEGGWLGIDAKEVERRLRVTVVLHDSPAMRAGMAPDDEVVAIDDHQIKDKEALDKRLRERRAGERVTLHVFRRGVLVPLVATLGKNPPDKWVIEEDKRSSARAKTLRRAWLSSATKRRPTPVKPRK